MKTTTKYLTILVAAVLIQSCSNSENKSTGNDTGALDSIKDSTAAMSTSTNAPDSSVTDESTFANTAAIGGMMEVEAATLAASQSKNKDVKEFAMLMLKDHGKANQELKMIAEKNAMQLPKVLPDEHAMHLANLKTLNDQKFDQQYITMMVNDHAKTVKLFEAGKQLSNAELKAFATNTLPVIQGHYEKAVKIAKTLNLSNTGNGDDIHGASPAEGHTN